MTCLNPKPKPNNNFIFPVNTQAKQSPPPGNSSSIRLPIQMSPVNEPVVNNQIRSTAAFPVKSVF